MKSLDHGLVVSKLGPGFIHKVHSPGKVAQNRTLSALTAGQV